MTPVERLAAALDKAAEQRLWDLDGDLLAGAVVDADPDMAADLALGAAWRRVLAALPEQGHVTVGRWEFKAGVVEYEATYESERMGCGESAVRDHRAGRDATEALEALAAALEARQPEKP